jgi:hypothetical protein
MRPAPAIDLTRSRDLGALFGDAFRLYRSYFGLFAGIAFAVVIPLDLLLYAAGTNPPPVVALLAGLAPWLVAIPLITAGHVKAVLALGGSRDASVGDSLRAAARRLPAVAGALVLVGLCTVVGLVLLIVPGVYVFVRLCVSAQSVIAEELGPVNAIRRSHELVEGHGWRVLGIALMIWIVSNVLGLVAAAPVQIAGIHAESRGIWLVGHMMGAGASLSFAALAGTLLYFDLRARFAGAPDPTLQYPAFEPIVAPERP